MVGRWWQQWRARREAQALQRRAIPDDLWKRTLVRYPFLRRHDAAAAAELRRLTSLFLDRKEFSAAGGLRLSDAIVVSIAAQAVLPVLRLGLAAYDDFVGVVVHPDEVVAHRSAPDEEGLVHEYDEPLVGEAMHRGPVMLTWRAVRQAGAAEGFAYNVVIHEFAHKLDMNDGLADGVPPLPPGLARADWERVLHEAYEAFVQQVERGDADASAMDPYGATAPDEFFAVASEAFFVLPERMKGEQPALYEMLARFYRQDPAAEMPPLPQRR